LASLPCAATKTRDCACAGSTSNASASTDAAKNNDGVHLVMVVPVVCWSRERDRISIYKNEL